MNKIQLSLKSYNKELLIFAIFFCQILFSQLTTNIKFIYLPKKKKFYDLLRSPHVNKKAWRPYKFIIYRTNIFITINHIELFYIIILKKLLLSFIFGINFTWKYIFQG